FIYIAGNYQHRIIGHIECFIKIHELRKRSLVYILLLAYRAPAVWIFGISVLKYYIDKLAIRRIVVALFFLFLHHLALRLHTYVVYLGMCHTLGFHPQCQFQLIRWQYLV